MTRAFIVFVAACALNACGLDVQGTGAPASSTSPNDLPSGPSSTAAAPAAGDPATHASADLAGAIDAGPTADA